MEFIGHIKKQVAEIATGLSALRNQDASGLAQVALTCFERVQLDAYGFVQSQTDFIRLFDADTKTLRTSFHFDVKNWDDGVSMIPS